MKRFPTQELPIDEVLPEIGLALSKNRNLVLRAATGAGKTTRVPPAMLRAGMGPILMLEPRRVAARAAARRMAEENGWRLGEEVGYQVRFERRAGPKTKILVVTEGILVQRLQHDPFLEGVSALIFDEFHERNLSSDLALAMARKVQKEARDDLRILLMSATLDPQPLVTYLGGEAECSSLTSDGRLFPVEVSYLERVDARSVPTLVREAIGEVLPRTPGDLLVFLPGVGEIRKCEDFLEPIAAQNDLDIVPLYGDLPPEKQDRALTRGTRRKVVLATNVAETSVTIDGVTGVIDSGQVRRLRFDAGLGLDRLELGRISMASADQRAGRAGRQEPGFCRRLWTEHDHRSLTPREAPEIQRVDLASTALELLAWGESEILAFPWLEAPERASLERALALLEDLGAARRGGGDRMEITSLGQDLVRLPIHPRLARLAVAGHSLGYLEEACLAAALLSERDVVFRPVSHRPVRAMREASSDILDRMEGVLELERSGYGDTALGPVDRGRARHALRVARQLEKAAGRRLGKVRAPGEDLDSALRRAILSAFPDRVAKRREPGSRRALMVGGRGIRLAEMSAVSSSELFLALELDAGRGAEGLCRQASAIDVEWLNPILTRDEAFFDAERERVAGRRRRLYRDLPIDQVEVDPGTQRAAEVLAEAAHGDLVKALGLGEPPLVDFLARVRSLRAWMPEFELPDFDPAANSGDPGPIGDLLPALCAGRRSFEELRRAPVLDILRGTFDYRQLEALERHAPERLEVPSGSLIRLQYRPGGEAPILAVRIQELFGCRVTPSVANGRVPVLLHLLAPNMRPQQVTSDLASFWSHTYKEVRKELAGRYPKHAWPEDPLNAEPMRGAKRRRR